MNFVNKLVSRILAVVVLILVFFQTRVALFNDDKDVMVLIISIVFMVLVVANLGYQIVLFVKYHKNYDNKFVGNDCAINLTVSCTALVFSVLDFVLAMCAYLYLI